MNVSPLSSERKAFFEKAVRTFAYLVTEFHYEMGPPESCTQPNGVVISDALSFLSISLDRKIVLHNSYHPVDYGFEIQCYRPSVSLGRDQMILVGAVLKEDQDEAQTYLEKLSMEFKARFYPLITGQEWDAFIQCAPVTLRGESHV